MGARSCTMSEMERWLNSRPAVLISWLIVALLGLGAAGFALFLLIPLVGGGASTEEAALRTVTVQPSAATATPGRTTLVGTVERVEGQALIVRPENSEPARVLVRQSAPVGTVTTSAPTDIRTGESASIAVVRPPDGRVLALCVRLQASELPPVSCQQRAGNSEPQILFGTVVSLDGNRLRVRTPRGDATFELSANPRITRFRPVSLTEVQTGQRVIVEGERLVDGSLAGLAVQVFAAR